jgi:hypothetical protein
VIQAVVQKPLKKSTLFAILPQLLDIRKQLASSSLASGGQQISSSSSSSLTSGSTVGAAAPDVKLNVLIAEV